MGPYTDSMVKVKKGSSGKASKYLALHLRFEIDMVAHSLCEFGGGEEERQELQAYREIHFPALVDLMKTKKYASSHYWHFFIFISCLLTCFFHFDVFSIIS